MSEIQYITVDPYCYTCKIKYHKITIFYKSGVKEEIEMEDILIYQLYYNYLKTDEDKRHFYYLNKSL
jgi:hypothetical protein